MRKKVKSFFAEIRQTLLTLCIDREIYHRIFPQIEKERDTGYPFTSEDEFRKVAIHCELDVKCLIKIIERRADKMPQAYGEAFRYIMYRDLRERLKMYEQLAARRVQPASCDPRFVAIRQ